MPTKRTTDVLLKDADRILLDDRADCSVHGRGQVERVRRAVVPDHQLARERAHAESAIEPDSGRLSGVQPGCVANSQPGRSVLELATHNTAPEPLAA